ncbi:MAG: hypothetical protein FWE23_05100 [Chitinivibrionia bacterium]|nr:hypothetical protein [Chitinivibrionia bacterium]
MPNTAEWIMAIASIIASIGGILAALVAVCQIPQLKKQLENGNSELRNANLQLKNTVLTNILSLETEMNIRKEKVDEVGFEYEKLKNAGKLTDNLKNVYKSRINAALENWFNSIDRLCFCIKNEYLIEKDWKAEYRDYIIDVVKGHEGKFGVASKYKNIVDINEKWLRV